MNMRAEKSRATKLTVTVAPSDSAEKKLNANAQLQFFPYTEPPKLFQNYVSDKHFRRHYPIYHYRPLFASHAQNIDNFRRCDNF